MSVEERSAARLAIVQALYQMEVAGKGLNEIYAEFESHWIGREIEGVQYKPAELQFFRDIVKGVLDNQETIDRALDSALQGGWPLQRIESVMRAILRAGGYELGFRRDIPVKVVIKEYVDVAGAFFGATESGMINAVLDRLARQARPEHFAEK
ncbi:NusB antitermination factor [Methylosinus sp. sav-2]|uniref:transcription antitermination factor NusB n=1 Tax=Methylosinus sp. sav-2 TaxID=2485168 RepID=UPI00047E67E6|nr:transcription antitermination factor NusB [Methylosinus sp. sav-2]TDX63142.1 NusB antitermination factor [Methylosinus sp. sav-2]